MMNQVPLDRDDLAILFLGVGAWMNREATIIVEFIDARLQAIIAGIPKITRLENSPIPKWDLLIP